MIHNPPNPLALGCTVIDTNVFCAAIPPLGMQRLMAVAQGHDATRIARPTVIQKPPPEPKESAS